MSLLTNYTSVLSNYSSYSNYTDLIYNQNISYTYNDFTIEDVFGYVLENICGFDFDEIFENITIPDYNYTIPDGNLTVPDYNYTIPDGNWTIPDYNYTIPDGNWTVPDYNYTIPDGNWTVPDYNYTIPDGNWTVPDYNFTIPSYNYTGNWTENYNYTIPSSNNTLNIETFNFTIPVMNNTNTGNWTYNNYTAPNYNYTIPDYNYTIPTYNNTGNWSIPDYNYTIPTYNNTGNWSIPDYNYTIPDYNYTIPDYNYTIPDYNHTIPDYNYTIPDYNYTIPDYNETIYDLGMYVEQLFENTTCWGVLNKVCYDFNRTISNYNDLYNFNITSFFYQYQQNFTRCLNDTLSNNNNGTYYPSSTFIPTSTPSMTPSRYPTSLPSMTPTMTPSRLPSMIPTMTPSRYPTLGSSSIRIVEIEANVSTSLSGILVDDFVEDIFFQGIYETMELNIENSRGEIIDLSGGIQMRRRRLTISDLLVDFKLNTQISSNVGDTNVLLNNFETTLSQKVSSGELRDKIVEVAIRENVDSMVNIVVNNVTVSMDVLSSVISTNYPTRSPTSSPNNRPSSEDKKEELSEGGIISMSVLFGLSGILMFIYSIYNLYMQKIGNMRKIHAETTVMRIKNNQIMPDTEIRGSEYVY